MDILCIYSYIFPIYYFCIIRLAEIIEKETEVFLKKDPDPFDNRHPSKLKSSRQCLSPMTNLFII